MMPPLRTLSKSERSVFLTMPVRVAKTTCSVGSQVWSTGPSSVLTIRRCTRMVAAIFSSGRRSRKLMMRPALGRAAALGQLEHLLYVAAPGLREEHQEVVRAGREEVLDEVVRVLFGRPLAGRHADDALAAAALRAVFAGGRALDEAAVRDRDDGALVGDEVFHVDLALVGDDLGQARRGVLRLDGQDLLLDDRQHARFTRQDVHQVLDRDHQLRRIRR